MKTILHSGTQNQYNLAPIKYKWAWDMLDKSLKNHWHPNEIPIVKTMSDFRSKLTQTEVDMFTKVFATLTTSDIAIQRNLAVGVYELIGAPEVACFIGNQIKEEIIHSITYQQQIEHLGLDEEYVYNLYLSVEEIWNKFSLADSYAKKLSEYRITGNPKYLFEGLIFYYAIFEGVWFYNGFSPIFSLGRRNLVTESCEQLQYIMRDEAQHTAFGIRLIKELERELNYKLDENSVHNIFREALYAEARYANKIIPPVLGYNADVHIEQSEFLANRRLKALGYKILFNAENTLPWLDEMVNIKKEKNFFENRVTEYQVGGSLAFGESNIDDITNWK